MALGLGGSSTGALLVWEVARAPPPPTLPLAWGWGAEPGPPCGRGNAHSHSHVHGQDVRLLQGRRMFLPLLTSPGCSSRGNARCSSPSRTCENPPQGAFAPCSEASPPMPLEPASLSGRRGSALAASKVWGGSTGGRGRLKVDHSTPGIPDCASRPASCSHRAVCMGVRLHKAERQTVSLLLPLRVNLACYFGGVFWPPQTTVQLVSWQPQQTDAWKEGWCC